MTDVVVRIGCGSGFWGDSPEGAAQLIEAGVDVLVFDYLAEVTMALLARARGRNPAAGFVPDFVDDVITPHAAEIARCGVKIVANAGGVNPAGCKAAVEAALARAGVQLSVALVTGDDLLPAAEALRAGGLALPESLVSLNAYLGARPIAAALAAGADIVITGRCVDSALVLGPLVQAFGWRWDDYDRLAGGSLAGHVIECGCQATGGLITDWRRCPSWDRMGYPIAECRPDGGFVLTKPVGTGGLVTPETVAEQIVYEVGDPAAYTLPDVVCDWSHIGLQQVGPERVDVRGARGRPPTGLYKLSAVAADGFRASGELTIAGREAAAKARRTGEAVLERTSRMMTAAGAAPYLETLVEVLGAESLYGPNGGAEAREVVLRVGVRHTDRAALTPFAREFLASATSMAQGITGLSAGRPKPRPTLRHHALLLNALLVPTVVQLDGREIPVEAPTGSGAGTAGPPEVPLLSPEPISGERRSVPLIALAIGRSGDKGDTANIGIIARRPEFLPVISQALTAEIVRGWFAHLVKGEVKRYLWPGLCGLNLVLEQALGGGGTASLRQDPQGKTYAQILMDLPVQVPAAWFQRGGPLDGWEEVRP